jgi:hypothetical protein
MATFIGTNGADHRTGSEYDDSMSGRRGATAGWFFESVRRAS